MISTPVTHEPDPSLVELVQFSSQALLRKTRRSPNTYPESLHLSPTNWFHSTTSYPAGEISHSDEVDRVSQEDHAPPLMPLRSRDLQALSELFDCEQIAEIELDIFSRSQNHFEVGK